MGEAMMTNDEKRKAQRQKPGAVLDVIDIHSDRKLGQVMDLSTEGLMMLSDIPITVNRIFELLIPLPVEIEGCSGIRLGVESLWTRESSDGTRYWTGFHIIAISDEDLRCVQTVISHA